MDIFTKYIEYGKGKGLVYFLIVSIVLSVIFGVNMNGYLQNASENEIISDFINRMPSFTIQNGQVVQPNDAYIFVPFEQGGKDGFILNTTGTPVNLTFENGVYVTKDEIYVKTGNDIQTGTLVAIDNKVISPETLRELVPWLITLATSFYALFMFGILWIGYGILYVLVKLFFLILGRTTCPYVRGRSVFVAWSSILILDYVLTALGHGFSPANALMLSLILAIFIVFRTPLHSMDVEESLNALGYASSKDNKDNMDFLDRELAKNPDSNATSFAAEKALSRLAAADADESETAVKTDRKKGNASTSKTKGKVAGRHVSTSAKKAKMPSKTRAAENDGRKSHLRGKAGVSKKKA